MLTPPYFRKTVTSVFLASLALSLIPSVAQADVTPSPAPPATLSTSSLPKGEQRYIVNYGNEANAEAESKSLEQQGIEVKETLSHTMKASVVVATPKEIESLRKSADVASVELDTPVSVSGATSIWGLDRVDQRSGRDGQYSIGDEGSGVNVYVVDTGLLTSHAEFTGRVPAMWWGVHDGNGIYDCYGHGTHVAGSIAGTTYGVAKKANIIPIRALECDGSGWASTIMAGIDWTVAHHTAGQPAVLNLSIGGFTNASFDQAVQSAVNDGITVVASAGNDGLDACGASPARVPSAITVAATNINDAQASWSDYGSCVDIQAPGVSIRSAWSNANTGYNTMDGTSMAAPHVSGAAAILLSRDRGLSPAQVHQSIVNNATTGVVSANKGATPNRMLFVPPRTLTPPSCSNLKFGDAWAGVGTHCGLQGGATSNLPAPEANATRTESTTPDTAVSAQQAPDQKGAVNSTEQAPVTSEAVQKESVIAPSEKPLEGVTEVAEVAVAEVDAKLEQTPVAAAPVAPAPTVTPVPSAAEALVVPQIAREETVTPVTESSDNTGWLIGGGVALLLVSALVAFLFRRNLKG